MSDDEQSKVRKLHNIVEKLHNNDKLTDAEERLITSTAVQDYARELSREAKKQTAEGRDLEKRGKCRSKLTEPAVA